VSRSLNRKEATGHMYKSYVSLTIFYKSSVLLAICKNFAALFLEKQLQPAFRSKSRCFVSRKATTAWVTSV